METSIRFVIFAQPGRWRDSLVALLKTLHPAGLFPIAPADFMEADLPGLLPDLPGQALIVLLDLPGLGVSGNEIMALTRKRWPGVRILALVETLRLMGGAAQGADSILHRSVSAGELLAGVQRLAGRPPGIVGEPMYPAGAYQRR